MISQLFRDECIQACRQVNVSKLSQVPPQHSAVLPSEILPVIAFQEGSDCIESGRRFGYSTQVLAEYFGKITSVEMDPDEEADERLETYANLRFCQSDGMQVVPDLVRNARRPVLVLDGPKGPPAIKLAEKVIESCRLIAIHDCHRGSESREIVIRNGMECWLTDDPDYVKEFGWIDTESLLHRGYKSHGDLLSCANVMAIIKGGAWK